MTSTTKPHNTIFHLMMSKDGSMPSSISKRETPQILSIFPAKLFAKVPCCQQLRSAKRTIVHPNRNSLPAFQLFVFHTVRPLFISTSFVANLTRCRYSKSREAKTPDDPFTFMPFTMVPLTTVPFTVALSV